MDERRTLLLSAHRIVGLTLAILAVGAAPTEEIRGSIDEVLRILKEPDLKAVPTKRWVALRCAIEPVFDFTENRRACPRPALAKPDRRRADAVHRAVPGS
jgi:hypothetical protein